MLCSDKKHETLTVPMHASLYIYLNLSSNQAIQINKFSGLTQQSIQSKVKSPSEV